MSKLNLNQRKLIAEGLMNLSIAFISISTAGPLISGAGIDSKVLFYIIFFIIISMLIIFLSVFIIKK